jgi:serine/threonine protein kinase
VRLQPGAQIGDYTIVEKIGEGGMSWVYLAEHNESRTKVVVKQLKTHLTFDQQLVDRFVQGAQIMLQLRHPHLARVLDFIERDGNYLMLEEYLSGGSLADLLDKGDSFSEQEAMRWCRDALFAINYTHENRIVHRDLKPGNLMLNEKGELKVTDFGIAKAFDLARKTRADASLGTLWYMSPEQIRSPHKVDHLTDVYAMGVVLYELLTRKVPFDGDSDYDIKDKVIRQPVPSPRELRPDISREAERIVLKAMQKRPGDRFGGCAEFAIEIDRCLSGERSILWEALQRIFKNKWAWAAVPLTLAVVTGLLFLFTAPTIDFKAEKSTVKLGESTQLKWNAQHADKVRIEPDLGEVAKAGSRTVRPTTSLTYLAIAIGRWRTVSERVHITVEAATEKTGVELNPIPWAYVVSIKTTDGKAADINLNLPVPTPLRIELRPGDYLIRLKLPEGQEQNVPLSVKPGNTVRWDKPIGTFDVEQTVNDLLKMH